MMHHNMVSNVLIISDTVQKEPQAVKEVIPIVLPEKKVKKLYDKRVNLHHHLLHLLKK